MDNGSVFLPSRYNQGKRMHHFRTKPKKKTKKENAFDFGYALAEQLAMPQIRWRSKNGLTSNVISKIQIVTSNKGKDNSGSNDPPNEPGRCKICLDAIKGQHYKTKKNKISRIVSFCMKCKEHCCKKLPSLGL